jgi:hypothetical protein
MRSTSVTGANLSTWPLVVFWLSFVNQGQPIAYRFWPPFIHSRPSGDPQNVGPGSWLRAASESQRSPHRPMGLLATAACPTTVEVFIDSSRSVPTCLQTLKTIQGGSQKRWWRLARSLSLEPATPRTSMSCQQIQVGQR